MEKYAHNANSHLHYSYLTRGDYAIPMATDHELQTVDMFKASDCIQLVTLQQ